MPNLDLDKKMIPISDDRVKATLGKDSISGNDLTTTISRLEKTKSENPSEDDEYTLNYLKSITKGERAKIDAPKRAIMNVDGISGKKSGGNAYKDTHEKDKDNANPTRVGGLAKLTSSGEHSKVSDQINNNRVTYYESYGEEIDNMRYLIEYMDNKKTKI